MPQYNCCGCTLQPQCNSATAPLVTDAIDELHSLIPIKNPLNEADAAAMPQSNVTENPPDTPPVAGTSGLPTQDAGPAPGIPVAAPAAIVGNSPLTLQDTSSELFSGDPPAAAAPLGADYDDVDSTMRGMVGEDASGAVLRNCFAAAVSAVGVGAACMLLNAEL